MRAVGDNASADTSFDRHHAWISWLLAFVGGFADAGRYILVGSFTRHVTGNTLLTAIYLVTGKVSLATSSCVAVLTFLGGTAFGLSWQHDDKKYAHSLCPCAQSSLLRARRRFSNTFPHFQAASYRAY